MSALYSSKEKVLWLLRMKLTNSSTDILYQCLHLFDYQGKTFMNNGLFIDVLMLRIE